MVRGLIAHPDRNKFEVIVYYIGTSVDQETEWARVGRYVQGARLCERLAAAFRSAGLDPAAYLRVAPWLDHESFAGFLGAMDIYLDGPAFSGYTTAWQAARRGLPIVTLEGPFLRQRLAAGLLRQMGVVDGIAGSRDEYVEIATRWRAIA